MEAGALRAPAALNRITVSSALLRLRSDDQLVALFREGNDAAFGVIHDRYRQRLFAYARQMLGGSRQDAEDALQDVFLRAYSTLRSHDRPVSLRAWLYRVAHNRCIDQLRKPSPPAHDIFDLSRKPLHDPIAEAERREDLRRLVADLGRLPEQQRSALLMREIDGLSYAELATALDVTVPAVKSLLVRARIGLVEAVEARDTACAEIRDDLITACDRGVRMSGRARRHVRDCAGCSEYRAQLRGVERRLGALIPGASTPLALIAKILGVGGAGSGAAAGASAGGGAAAGGGALALAGTGTAAKVAAIVCCAALTAGGAVEVRQRIAEPETAPAGSSAARHAVAPAAPAVQGTASAAAAQTMAAAAHRARLRRAQEAATADAAAEDDVISPHVAPTLDGDETIVATGGVLAPEEDPGTADDGLPQADAYGVLTKPRPIPADLSGSSAAPAPVTSPSPAKPAATVPAATAPAPPPSARAASPPTATDTGGAPATSSGGVAAPTSAP